MAYRDRYVTVSPALVAKEPAPAWPDVITWKAVDEHDEGAVLALLRANGKLDAIRCAGVAGADAVLASPCPPVLLQPPAPGR